MGRRRRRSKFLTRKRFYIFEFIIVLLIIFTSLLNIYLSTQVSQDKDSFHILINKQNNTKKDINNYDKQIKAFKTQITAYQEIDKTINNKRDEYFKKIKALEDDILNGKSDKKIAYLTFDDGPYYNTYRVFDILDEYHVKATFFTISMNGEACFDNKNENCFALYKEYVKRGHTIANHTYTHAIRGGLYNSVDSFMDAIIRQEEQIKNQSGGYSPNIVRFPGGSAQAKDLKEPIIEKLRERGYGWVDWSAEDGDGKGIPSKEVGMQKLTATINDKIEVILFHDYNRFTTELLPDAIQYLRDNGYELYPLFYESNMIKK